ncbi:hypothetical protein VB735_23460 [Halotia wernerae UHCC 0503]|nr:hypothetical protein [Halotia wernerae UHCC 0503]
MPQRGGTSFKSAKPPNGVPWEPAQGTSLLYETLRERSAGLTCPPSGSAVAHGGNPQDRTASPVPCPLLYRT